MFLDRANARTALISAEVPERVLVALDACDIVFIRVVPVSVMLVVLIFF